MFRLGLFTGFFKSLFKALKIPFKKVIWAEDSNVVAWKTVLFQLMAVGIQ